MSGPPVSPPSALSPFNHPKADVILRSSDSVDFRVFRLFLSLASPFFETLFDLPQPSKETGADTMTIDGPPVIPITEDSKTLDVLLRFCYPCTLAEDPSLAKKYSLDAIEKSICKRLVDPKVLDKDSFRCFAIACNARLKNECLIAAKHTLREPLIPAWFEEIDLITSSDLLILLAYHQKCGSIVQELWNDLSWMNDHYQQWNAIPWMFAFRPDGGYCGCQYQTTSKYKLFGYCFVKWFEDFMEVTFIALRDKPCTETIQSNIENAIQTAHQRSCQYCTSSVSGGMHEFFSLFQRKVDELIDKVCVVHFSPEARYKPVIATPCRLN
ncbi:hypothetical protein ID866_9039 [Astraeus odoratus]|nr:hypothetical protein ID866_9039 [Astraeus odoratus]